MIVYKTGGLMVLAAGILLILTLMNGCSTPQERSGVNPRPFNSPTSWERNPYGDNFRN